MWRLRLRTKRSHRVTDGYIRGWSAMGPRRPGGCTSPWCAGVGGRRPWRCSRRSEPWVSASAMKVGRELHCCWRWAGSREILGHTGLRSLEGEKWCARAGGIWCAWIDRIAPRALRLRCPRRILRIRASRMLRDKRRLRGRVRRRDGRIKWGNKRGGCGIRHRVFVSISATLGQLLFARRVYKV